MSNTDVLTEWEHGPGAVRMPAKLVLRPSGKDDGFTQIGLWGSAMSHVGSLVLPENEDRWEMWECEIIIIPRRKYSGRLPNGKTAFGGMRADQMLCGGFGIREYWGPCYYDINDPPAKADVPDSKP